MAKMGNPKGNPGNNPKKGSSFFIEPIRDKKDLNRIERALRGEPRNHLLFVMGVENGIRTGDLLKLKVGQVRNLKVGGKIYIKEGKTGKKNWIGITPEIHKSLLAYLEALQPSDDDYLFPSRKGDGPLSTTAVNQLIKKWTAEHAKLKGSFGAHTLRKTWGFHKRMAGVSWANAMKVKEAIEAKLKLGDLGLLEKKESPKELEQMTFRFRRGVSNSQVDIVKNVASGVFNYAVEDDVIESNPCNGLGDAKCARRRNANAFHMPLGFE